MGNVHRHWMRERKKGRKQLPHLWAAYICPPYPRAVFTCPPQGAVYTCSPHLEDVYTGPPQRLSRPVHVTWWLSKPVCLTWLDIRLARWPSQACPLKIHMLQSPLSSPWGAEGGSPSLVPSLCLELMAVCCLFSPSCSRACLEHSWY